MIWVNDNKDMCISKSISTLENLIFQANITNNKREIYNSWLYANKESFFEKEEEILNINDFESVQSIHPFLQNEEINMYGVIVILKDKHNNKIILDGNHRINTIKYHNLTNHIPTIVLYTDIINCLKLLN